jgi:DNA-binding response OmpR family regulator
MRSTLIEEKPFVPDDLRACVEALLERDPSMSWDAAVWNIRAGREHTDEII